MVDNKSVPSFGEVLTKRFLEPNGISQYQLAKAIGKAPTAVNRVISGKVGLSPEMAALIGKALGTGAEYWIDVDAAYQISKLEEKDVVVLLDRGPDPKDEKDIMERTMKDAEIGRAIRGAFMAMRIVGADDRESLSRAVSSYLMYGDASPSDQSMSPAARAMFCQFLVDVGEDVDMVLKMHLDSERE